MSKRVGKRRLESFQLIWGAEIVRKHNARIEFLENVAVLRSSAEEHNNGKRHKSMNSKDFYMEDVLEGHLLRARLEYGPQAIY